MFSKTCEYGIRAIIYIAHQSQIGKRVNLKEVAEAIDSPVAFTAKILQSLAKNELIFSVKGSGGGYELLKEHWPEVTLHSVITSIDGEQIYDKCGLGLKECNEIKPCPVHHRFKSIRDELKKMLRTTTIRDLANEMNLGVTYLKI